MSCAIAVANSPAFSPRISSFFCKSSSSSSSPINRNLHIQSSSSPSTSAAAASVSVSLPCVLPQSPLSPLISTLRLPKQSTTNYEHEPICSTSSSSSSSNSSVLKRKRPARISIPITSSVSLDTVEKTRVEVGRLDEVKVEEEVYSVYCKRGKRGPMQDRYSAIVDHAQNGSKQQAFFGVFDGHGGAKAAEFASKNMGRNIMNEVALRSDGGLEDAVREGYLTTDSEFLKLNANGGSCCVTALIQNRKLILSNAGDCRAVMSRGGVAEALTVDHRPSSQDEMERIQSLGGYVDCCRGVWRIQGSLAVSRGIGDSHLKRWVIAEPETKILMIEPECEFLILASDGLWDKVSNEEAVEVVRPWCVGVDNPKPFSACKKLVDLAIRRGSSDDISTMVIQLGQFVQ